MGSYMHLINDAEHITVEAYKYSGGGENVNRIEEPEKLVKFLDYCHKKSLKIEVVSDYWFCDRDPRLPGYKELDNA